MRIIYSILLLLTSLLAKAQTETEPNGTFETASPLQMSATLTGTINNTSDPIDYYRTLLPTDGTLTIYITATNNGPNAGYLFLYGYDKRKASGQVINEYIRVQAHPPVQQ